MDKLGRGYRAKNLGYDSNELNGVGFGLNSPTVLVIRVPESRFLRVMSRSMFLAIVILALPTLGSMIRASSNGALYKTGGDSVISSGFKILPILFRDLLDEGLIKKGHKGFILEAEMGEIEDDFEFLKDAGIDLLTGIDLQDKKVVENTLFDFVFSLSFNGILGFDGVVKDGGLVISPLGHDHSTELRLLRNHKIVYLRRFENTVVAMRKNRGSSNGRENPPVDQVLFGVTLNEKKAAQLKGLEDAYLEPPRGDAFPRKSSFTSRKIKFLPDLLKESLDKYPRRVFISDDSSALDWFYKNYPMRGQEFEVYDLDIVSDSELSDSVLIQGTEVSTWLTKNIERHDYVVMKAEADLVEKILRDRTLYLVDELFLECKNQWEEGEIHESSKRAYWQCLALYGKVKDEGIAVHQWWN
ncbi:hypothetical protein F511_14157 [Dorcoceras hygrometricum]|uniref:DUF7870 domain-containing protein n=1 Tax=Dorcoceras hygrometricum TaxID=472368 RepID=A0A2Z7D5U5_9LAMI|nr:hypothetical protein F511_14157 [Dorcoceras hygrometricum]